MNYLHSAIALEYLLINDRRIAIERALTYAAVSYGRTGIL